MLMHVRHIVVAITKADASTSEATAALISLTEAEFTSRGITAHDIIITSAHSGLGIEDLRHVLTTLTTQVSDSDISSPTRFFVDRVFTIAGAGTVVTGTLGGAVIHVGEELIVARTQKTIKVRSIQHTWIF